MSILSFLMFLAVKSPAYIRHTSGGDGVQYVGNEKHDGSHCEEGTL